MYDGPRITRHLSQDRPHVALPEQSARLGWIPLPQYDKTPAQLAGELWQLKNVTPVGIHDLDMEDILRSPGDLEWLLRQGAAKHQWGVREHYALTDAVRAVGGMVSIDYKTTIQKARGGLAVRRAAKQGFAKVPPSVVRLGFFVGVPEGKDIDPSYLAEIKLLKTLSAIALENSLERPEALAVIAPARGALAAKHIIEATGLYEQAACGKISLEGELETGWPNEEAIVYLHTPRPGVLLRSGQNVSQPLF